MGRLFCAKSLRKEVDAVCLSFHFERIYIPDSFDGTPESAYQEALQKKQAYDEEEQKLKSSFMIPWKTCRKDRGCMCRIRALLQQF